MPQRTGLCAIRTPASHSVLHVDLQRTSLLYQLWWANYRGCPLYAERIKAISQNVRVPQRQTTKRLSNPNSQFRDIYTTVVEVDLEQVAKNFLRQMCQLHNFPIRGEDMNVSTRACANWTQARSPSKFRADFSSTDGLICFPCHVREQMWSSH